MKDVSIPVKSMRDAVLKGRKNGCDELVLSGGEPTLYPEYIMDLISLAEKLGYKKYIIQTNGYGLAKSDSLVLFLSDIAVRTELCISFSVHGHVARIHDSISGSPGAFENLMEAMRRISRTRCSIYTNTVINASNIDFLKDIAALLIPYNPVIMQFSMMHLQEKSPLYVSFADSVQAIKELRKIVSLDVLKTEGVPYCCLHGMEKCVGESAWPTVLDLYNKDNDYMSDFKQLEYGMRSKMDNCDKCVMDDICMGVWAEHFEEFSSLGIHPIG